MAKRLVPALVAVASVLAVLNIAVWLSGAAPARILSLVLAGTLGSGYGLGQTLAKATPLIFTGASVAFALRARLFNIGAEGQCLAGVLGAAYMGAHLPAGTPALVALPVALAAAAFAGWLRGRFGTHEVISTLMLNGLVAVLTTWLYSGPLRVGAQVHTAEVVQGARLPMAGPHVELFRGSGLNASLVLAVLAAFSASLYLRHTRGGLRVRALGSAPGACEALGVDTARTSTTAMAISGALAGLAGIHSVLGLKGYAEQGLGSGVGFVGIAVALLGAGSPAGIILAAVLFGALSQGGLSVNAIVPADVLSIAQAATIVAVAALGAGAMSTRRAA